jgi:hypothetical protein
MKIELSIKWICRSNGSVDKLAVDKPADDKLAVDKLSNPHLHSMAKDVDLIFEIILMQVFVENDKKLNTSGFNLNKICCIYFIQNKEWFKKKD